MPEEHWETQALSLSTLVLIDGVLGMLEFDWIGNIEQMAQTLPGLFRKIEARAGRRLPAELKAAVLREAKVPTLQGSLSIRRCRSSELDDLVRRVYVQDVACFESAEG